MTRPSVKRKTLNGLECPYVSATKHIINSCCAIASKVCYAPSVIRSELKPEILSLMSSKALSEFSFHLWVCRAGFRRRLSPEALRAARLLALHTAGDHACRETFAYPHLAFWYEVSDPSTCSLTEPQKLGLTASNSLRFAYGKRPFVSLRWVPKKPHSCRFPRLRKALTSSRKPYLSTYQTVKYT
jgi:hypothetical protein